MGRAFSAWGAGFAVIAAVLAAGLASGAADARTRRPQPAPAAAQARPAGTPGLIVAISVDQLSADLYAEYRAHFTGGLKRLGDGAVFPSGYQSHSATETCPGHSTILTGAHPARTGIIANGWMEPNSDGSFARVYCLDRTGARKTLMVPTLGERLVAGDPLARNVAVSAKDRGAIMMAGESASDVYFWSADQFVAYRNGVPAQGLAAINQRIAGQVAVGAAALPVPLWCAARRAAIALEGAVGASVGAHDFASAALPADATSDQRRAANERFRISPHIDAATIALALALVEERQLGQRGPSDVLSISLSGTDYVGHAFGTEGLEQCVQLAELDRQLAGLFSALDGKGIDYAVVLTADHGGLDMTERRRQQGQPDARRVATVDLPVVDGKAKKVAATSAEALSLAVIAHMGAAAPTGYRGQLIYSTDPVGDFYINRALDEAQRRAVVDATREVVLAMPDVAAVLSAEEITAMPAPPEADVADWSLAQRVRASYYPGRSGDFILLLKRGVMPIPAGTVGYVATHGSPWDYDRRVPILFWRKGMARFEQPHPVQTVDIAPTLLRVLGQPIPADAFDGRCLDLDAGEKDTCQ